MHLKFFKKLPVVIAFAIVTFFEFIEYSIAPVIMWPKCSPGSDSTKILIVGDPQLLGQRFSAPNLLGLIYRWDADQYLKKTFSLAFNHVKPDITLFLGDNLDEGEIATDLEFSQYFQRFKQVFKEVDFKKAIIIPGDNDIGGESQPPQREMEQRFNKHFREDIHLCYKFLEFVKINYITFSHRYQSEVQNISQDSVKIILSHLPMTVSYSSFVTKAISFVQPHIILSAHDHKSQHVVTDRKTGDIIKTQSSYDYSSSSFNISESVVHEIIAPTCSYRMGTHKMGYGVLEISKSGMINYSVLWLPSRFRQLYFHLFVLCSLLLYIFCLVVRSHIKHSYSFSRQKRIHCLAC